MNILDTSQLIKLNQEVYEIDRQLHHRICLRDYENSFVIRKLTDNYRITEIRRLNDVFNSVKIGDETVTRLRRDIDTFDLTNPRLAKKITDSCYRDLGSEFSKARAIACLKSIDKYCLYLKNNPTIYIAGQKSLYLPDYYGHIESPVNLYTIPRNKPCDASKLYLTNSEYKYFFYFLWNKLSRAIETNTLKPFHQIYFICIIAGELGLRLQEILGLELRHINLEDNICLVIRGKGTKGSGYRKREVPLTDFFRASLQDFLKYFPRERSKPLFQNVNGDYLSSSTAHKWRQAILQEIKTSELPIIIEERFGFHALRRTYARSYLENGGNFLQLKKNTGWKFASTAGCYIGVNK